MRAHKRRCGRTHCHTNRSFSCLMGSFAPSGIPKQAMNKLLLHCSLLRADASNTHPAGASKERERNSFFDSLRRKSRSPSLAPLGEGEDAEADVAVAADTEPPLAATAAEPASPVTNARGTLGLGCSHA